MEGSELMSRNYMGEYNWKRKKYVEIRANIDRELGEALKLKLQKNNKSIAEWIRENAQRYLDGVE